MNGPAIYRVQRDPNPTIHHAAPAACCDCGQPAKYLTVDKGDTNYQHRCADHAAAYAKQHAIALSPAPTKGAKPVNIKTAKRNARRKEVK